MTAVEVIALLQLATLPGEGGYYCETYRSDRRTDDRSQCTAIYYLLTAETVSLFHRLKSDELWHFYQGNAVEQVLLHQDGRMEVIVLGHDLQHGERHQSLVPAGMWQGARLVPGGTWALLGCTVAPGFEFADWELGDRVHLLEHYPQLTDWPELLPSG